jgi:hypothetical protein
MVIVSTITYSVTDPLLLSRGMLSVSGEQDTAKALFAGLTSLELKKRQSDDAGVIRHSQYHFTITDSSTLPRGIIIQGYTQTKQDDVREQDEETFKVSNSLQPFVVIRGKNSWKILEIVVLSSAFPSLSQVLPALFPSLTRVEPAFVGYIVRAEFGIDYLESWRQEGQFLEVCVYCERFLGECCCTGDRKRMIQTDCFTRV